MPLPPDVAAHFLLSTCAKVPSRAKLGDMPPSLKRIRETMQVQPTARDKGVKVTLTVVAYDNGIVEVNGVPMSSPQTGWIDAAEVLVAMLNEFHRQATKRPRRELATTQRA